MACNFFLKNCSFHVCLSGNKIPYVYLILIEIGLKTILAIFWIEVKF